MERLAVIAGRALRPLPYESSVSVFWRVGWRNRFSSASLLKFFTDWRGYPVGNCVARLDWITSAKVEALTGWSLPSDEERDFASSLGHLDDEIWLHKRMRFCPLCLELGFHSFLHQCLAVSFCPVHNLPLMDRGYSCNHLMPEYRHSPALYDQPYYCHCGQPYSGVGPALILDDMLREQAESIEADLTPVFDWWIRTKDARSWASRFSSKGLLSDHLSTWCSREHFLRCQTLHKEALPGLQADGLTTPTTSITWNVRVAESPDRSFHSLGYRRNWKERVTIPRSVYRCVLRQLRDWICHQEGLSSEDFYPLLQTRVHYVKDLRPRIVAFMCLRTQLEIPAWWLTLQPEREAELQDEPHIGVPIVHERTPRLAWRAIFIGLYASWYLRILRSADKKLTDIKFQFEGEAGCLFVWNKIEYIDQNICWCGEVIFPSIDGLGELCAHSTAQLC